MSELLTYLLNNEPQFRRARLAALYSDFSTQRTLNPDGYAANISAWLKGLSSAARAGVIPSAGSNPSLLILQSDNELLRALNTKEWGRPLSLGMVIQEAVANKEMMPLRQFMDAQESIYYKSWNLTPWGIMGWGLRQLGLVGGISDKLPVERLVIIRNVEEAAKEFMGKSVGKMGRVDRIYSKQAFRAEFGDVLGEKALSEADMEAFLKFLVRDKEVLAYDGETIKLKVPEEQTTIITEEDTSIASLKTLIADLEVQTQLLTEKVEELGNSAKEAVAKNNRVTALSALRSKKLAESALQKRHATLHQLEEVFSKIEQAADQVALVRVMEASTRALSGFNKEVGGIDRVDAVVDHLREEMEQVDEVGNVLAEAGQSVDETEVDDELEAMERIEREKQEAIERAEREEREKKERARKKEQEEMEAAETKQRLDALEEVEREAISKAVEGKRTADAVVSGSTEKLRRLSLEPEPDIPA